jgi:hypothetical protein
VLVNFASLIVTLVNHNHLFPQIFPILMC